MAIKSSDQISIVDLTDGYSVILTNDSFTFLGDTSHAIASSTTTTVIAMCGGSQVAASVNLNNVVKPAGVTVTKDNNATQPTGSPPRARGKLALHAAPAGVVGISPACAGKT